MWGDVVCPRYRARLTRINLHRIRDRLGDMSLADDATNRFFRIRFPFTDHALKTDFRPAEQTMRKSSLLGVACSHGHSSSQRSNGETLKLPDNLVGFTSHDGESYFAESDAREAYFPLASNFLTQKTQAYCGVASIVMVLNALEYPGSGGSRIRALPHLHPGQRSHLANGRRPSSRGAGAARHDARSDRRHPGHPAGEGRGSSCGGKLGRRVPHARAVLSRRAWPFRAGQLFAPDDRAGERRPYLAARRL